MKLPSLWSGNRSVPSLWRREQDFFSDPLSSIRREMDDMMRAFDRGLPAVRLGAGAPMLDVSEDKDAINVAVELPGVEEKDLHISLEDNHLVISGEKKEETKRDEKSWHVEERSYGSFYRSIALPFQPKEGDIDAEMDKGVLHVRVKKPAESARAAKSIEIKPGKRIEGQAAPGGISSETSSAAGAGTSSQTTDETGAASAQAQTAQQQGSQPRAAE